MPALTGTTCANDILKKLFNNTAISWDANTNLYLALHTASLVAGSNQSTNECTYTGYARVPVLRTSAGWTVATNQVSNAAAIAFAANGGASQVITSASIGTAASGAGEMLFAGDLNANITLTTGNNPQFGIGALALGMV